MNLSEVVSKKIVEKDHSFFIWDFDWKKNRHGEDYTETNIEELFSKANAKDFTVIVTALDDIDDLDIPQELDIDFTVTANGETFDYSIQTTYSRFVTIANEFML